MTIEMAFNLVLSLVMAIGGFAVKRLVNQHDKLQGDLDKLRDKSEAIRVNYQTSDEAKAQSAQIMRHLERIENKLERIDDKLEKKADK